MPSSSDRCSGVRPSQLQGFFLGLYSFQFLMTSSVSMPIRRRKHAGACDEFARNLIDDGVDIEVARFFAS